MVGQKLMVLLHFQVLERTTHPWTRDKENHYPIRHLFGFLGLDDSNYIYIFA